MKAKKYMVVGIIVLLISLVGSIGTYAWFTWSSTNNTSLTMSIGELADVSFSSGNDISTNALAPVFNYTDGERTTFTIRNKSDSELKYKVLLNITSIEDELKSSSLKYKLLSGNNILLEGDFSNITSNSSTTIYESTLTKGNISFTFYLYIDGNEENDLNMMGKNITGNITVEANADTNLAEYITNLYTDASKTTVANNSVTYNYATSVGLMNDRLGSSSTNMDAGNIRYYGASPNNYVYFNCDDYSNQTSDTCEIWRIIGVFEGKVKIMRRSQIESLAWDQDKNIDSSKTTYDNDWSTSSLQVLLNTSYLNRTADVTYYSGSRGTTTTKVSTSTTGIKDSTRNMISETTWYLRGWNTNEVYADEMYEYERTTGKVYNTTRPTSWTGKIALAYPSDYGYATDLNLCKKTLYNYSDSTCTTNNWMKSILASNFGWLLTPGFGNSNRVWNVDNNGFVYGEYYSTYSSYGVTPVLFLNSELSLKEGTDGSSSNPYQIKVS